MNDKMKRGETEVFFESLLTGDVGQAIMNQEARGQQQLVHSDVLPRKLGGYGELDATPVYEALGIKVLGEADDLFYNVELPQGWQKQATDHSMHSTLLDDKGRNRAGIFYKAAFYDRKAHIGFNRRYNYRVEPECGWSAYDRENPAPFVCRVMDCENIIWQSKSVPDADYNAQDALGEQGKEWLNEHYPGWQSAEAYW